MFNRIWYALFFIAAFAAVLLKRNEWEACESAHAWKAVADRQGRAVKDLADTAEYLRMRVDQTAEANLTLRKALAAAEEKARVASLRQTNYGIFKDEVSSPRLIKSGRPALEKIEVLPQPKRLAKSWAPTNPVGRTFGPFGPVDSKMNVGGPWLDMMAEEAVAKNSEGLPRFLPDHRLLSHLLRCKSGGPLDFRYWYWGNLVRIDQANAKAADLVRRQLRGELVLRPELRAVEEQLEDALFQLFLPAARVGALFHNGPARMPERAPTAEEAEAAAVKLAKEAAADMVRPIKAAWLEACDQARRGTT